MLRSSIAFTALGLLLLAGAGSSALLELDEMRIQSSDTVFTLTLDLAANSPAPLARWDKNGDIVVELLNCVAGPSLSDVRLEEGLVRAVQLESFKAAGQPALRIRVQVPPGASFDRELDREKFVLRVTPGSETESEAPATYDVLLERAGLSVAPSEQSTGSDSDGEEELSPWRRKLLSATLGDLQQELQASRARERAMRQELEKARRQLREAETPNAELEAEVERYRELVRELLGQNEDLSRRLIEAQRVDPEKDTMISELRATETELRGQLEIAQQALDLAQVDTLGLANRLQEAEDEVTRLVQANLELSRQQEQAETSLSELQAQRQDSQAALDLAEVDTEGLAARLQSADEEVGELVEMNRDLNRLKEDAETALSEARAREEASQLERANLEETLRSAREEIRQLVLLNASLQEVRKVSSQPPPTATPAPAVQLRPTRGVVGMAAAPCLRLRRRPGFGGEVLNCLPPGAAVVVLEERSGWSRISLASGVHQEGWVAAPYLEARSQ